MKTLYFTKRNAKIKMTVIEGQEIIEAALLGMGYQKATRAEWQAWKYPGDKRVRKSSPKKAM